MTDATGATRELIAAAIFLATYFVFAVETVPGFVANLIVAESVRGEGVTITFGEYLRVSLPVTVASLTAGRLLLAGRRTRRFCVVGSNCRRLVSSPRCTSEPRTSEGSP
ncbi:MAG: hypothetical protein HY553_03345 [Elusimicrobia bacterium]|nr:hypothetical protein [Elusimicrobiota bacterium]